MAIRLNNLALLFLVGFEFEGVRLRGCCITQALKSVLPMTTRSDIPCPRPFKRDNEFY
jgi:hypothetical protein